jgi:hypothetical protein
MDMIVLNLKKPADVLKKYNDYYGSNIQAFDVYMAERRKDITEYIKEHLQEWMETAIEDMEKKHTKQGICYCGIPFSVMFENEDYALGACGLGIHGYRYYSDEARSCAGNVFSEILKSFNNAQSGSIRYNADIKYIYSMPYVHIKTGNMQHTREYDLDVFTDICIRKKAFSDTKVYFKLNMRIINE